MVGKIEIIKEFTNDKTVCGVYDVEVNGKQEIFIRNGNSISAIIFYKGRSANECISTIRNDVAIEFINELAKQLTT